MQSATTKESPTSTYFPALTGLRAVAAYLVFLHHYNPASTNTFAYSLFAQGYIGVSVFFVLSGLLIYHRYADVYLNRQSWSWRRYLQNRFARIYPLYGLLLLLTIGVNTLAGHPMNWFTVVLNLTLLKGFFEAYKFSGIPQSWSLTVETCFYILAPILFIILQRRGPVRLTAVLLGSGVGLSAMIDQHSLNDPVGNLPFVLFYTFFGRSFEFVVGMWLGKHCQQNICSTIRYATVSGMLSIGGCILWQTGAMKVMDPTGLFWSEVVVYNFLLPVAIGLFLLGLLQEKTPIRTMLEYPVIQTLGRSSYAFYLIHIGVIANSLQKAGITNPGLLFSLLILTAQGLYRFIEKPLCQWLRSYD
jgi:peptidoglycan/LPS O-acetylase OafA/YrhL